jgi:hypothetical protein
MVPGSKEKNHIEKSDTEMHRQMHRTDVVPKLAGRQSMSLIARSKKLELSEQPLYNLIFQCQDRVALFVSERTD